MKSEVEKLEARIQSLLEHNTEEVERRRAAERRTEEARYCLRAFVHAHANGNSVPPHLVERARETLFQ